MFTMQQGVRAVESYRRSLLIDGVTSDNDSIAPVYKLEEICTLIRTSSLEIVRELMDRILKRLDHRSPVVKQKALRLIKFAAGKAGPEFRREIQRQAVVIRKLLHHRGQPDALKGDALNKAVRETAQETLSAIFASNDKSFTDEASKRMEGFGNTNLDFSTREVEKSMLDDVMEFGSSTIRQMSGYSNSSSGTYRGPNLRRSLTERETKYSSSDNQASTYSLSSHETLEPRGSQTEFSGGGSVRQEGRFTTQEDRLVDLNTTPGGVRLQPSREAVENFLTATSKLDGGRLGQALQSKLQSPAWQVRLRATCLVEAVLRQSDSNDVFQIVGRMFEEDCGPIVENAQSPQASLKEKSKKVLYLLGLGNLEENQGRTASKRVPQQPVVLPDLMDGWDTPEETTSSQSNGTTQQHESAPSVCGESLAVDDLLGGFGWNENAQQTTETNKEEDIFAGFSLNASSTTTTADELLRVDSAETAVSTGTSDGPGLFEGLSFEGEGTASTQKAQPATNSLVDLLGDLSTENPGKANGDPVDPFHDLFSSAASSKAFVGSKVNTNQLPSLASKQGLGRGQVSLAGGALPSRMVSLNSAKLMQMSEGISLPNLMPQGFGPGPASFAGMGPHQMHQRSERKEMYSIFD